MAEGRTVSGGSRGSSFGMAISNRSVLMISLSMSPVGKGSARSTQSTRPCCSDSTASALVSSRRNSFSSGRSVRRRGSIFGRRKGAMVGITLIRSVPASGLPAACTRSDSSSASRSRRCAFSTTWLPSGVNRTTRRVRSTSTVSSRDSSSRIPADRVDWDTKLASAARPKWPCSCRATKYCSCLMVGR